MKILKNKLLQMLLLAIFVGASLSSCGELADDKITFNIPTWLIGNWKSADGQTDRTFTADDMIDNNAGGSSHSEAVSDFGGKKENEISTDTVYQVTTTGGIFPETVKFEKVGDDTLSFTYNAQEPQTLTKYTK